jgi:hypothetical protein
MMDCIWDSFWLIMDYREQKDFTFIFAESKVREELSLLLEGKWKEGSELTFDNYNSGDHYSINKKNNVDSRIFSDSDSTFDFTMDYGNEDNLDDVKFDENNTSETSDTDSSNEISEEETNETTEISSTNPESNSSSGSETEMTNESTEISSINSESNNSSSSSESEGCDEIKNRVEVDLSEKTENIEQEVVDKVEEKMNNNNSNNISNSNVSEEDMNNMNSNPLIEENNENILDDNNNNNNSENNIEKESESSNRINKIIDGIDGLHMTKAEARDS